MHPWRNWIAHQIPILTVGGSNPFGCAIQKVVLTDGFSHKPQSGFKPYADAIDAERSNRYYARVARYESVWVRQKNTRDALGCFSIKSANGGINSRLRMKSLCDEFCRRLIVGFYLYCLLNSIRRSISS